MGDALSCAGRCSDSWRAQRAPAVGVVGPHAMHTPHARDIPGWPSAAALKGSTAAVSSGTASSRSPTLASLSATSVSTSGEQLTCTTIALSAARGMQVRAREAHDERAQKARRASCCQGGARDAPRRNLAHRRRQSHAGSCPCRVCPHARPSAQRWRPCAGDRARRQPLAQCVAARRPPGP